MRGKRRDERIEEVGLEADDEDAPEAGERLEYRFGVWLCLLYTSDAADERSSVDLGGRRIIKKKHLPTPT